MANPTRIPVLPPLPVISTFSTESVILVSSQYLTNTVAASLGNAANRAFFVPIHLEVPTVITGMFILNGATVSGNVDIGIYDVDFSLIVSAGSTAQTGTSTSQSFTFSNTTLGPGDYYMGVVLDNTTGTILLVQAGNPQYRATGVLRKDSTFPLPATISSPTPYVNGIIPVIGIFVYPKTGF